MAKYVLLLLGALGVQGQGCGTAEQWMPNVEPPRPCLCAFDIDRTLTGYQDLISECPEAEVIHGVNDYAYLYDTPAGYGNLTLSTFFQALNSTFCSLCYLGIATAGGASQDEEKRILLDRLRWGASPRAAALLPEDWLGVGSEGITGEPPFVVFCGDGHKHSCTQSIVEWYEARNISIADSDVYFFDDKESNIAPFAETGFNAAQISCGSRNGSRGLCGAVPEEVQKRRGVFLCKDGEQICIDPDDDGLAMHSSCPQQAVSLLVAYLLAFGSLIFGSLSIVYLAFQ